MANLHPAVMQMLQDVHKQDEVLFGPYAPAIRQLVTKTRLVHTTMGPTLILRVQDATANNPVLVGLLDVFDFRAVQERVRDNVIVNRGIADLYFSIGKVGPPTSFEGLSDLIYSLSRDIMQFKY